MPLSSVCRLTCRCLWILDYPPYLTTRRARAQAHPLFHLHPWPLSRSDLGFE